MSIYTYSGFCHMGWLPNAGMWVLNVYQQKGGDTFIALHYIGYYPFSLALSYHSQYLRNKTLAHVTTTTTTLTSSKTLTLIQPWLNVSSIFFSYYHVYLQCFVWFCECRFCLHLCRLTNGNAVAFIYRYMKSMTI